MIVRTDAPAPAVVPLNSTPKMLRRQVLARRGSLGTSLLLLALVASARADTPAEQYQFAAGLYGQKLYSLAAEKLSAFLTANPKDANARMAAYQLAAALYRASDAKGGVNYAAAAAAYERALASYPDADPKIASAARFELTEAQFQLKNYAKAATAASAFLASKPADDGQASWALYYLGESQAALKKPTEATAALQRAVTEFPQSEAAPYAQFSLGFQLAASGKHTAAASAFRTVLTRYPNADVATEARLRAADSLLAAQAWAEAGTLYRAVLADAKSKDFAPEARLGAAEAAFGAKNWSGAATAYTAVIAALAPNAPAGPGAQLRLGDSLFNAKEWQKAVEAYTPLATTPDAARTPQALYFRGGAYRELGNLKASAADYQKVVGTYPNHALTARAALRQGDVLAQAKDVAGAGAAYQIVLTRFAGSPAAKEAQEALVALAAEVSAPSGGAASASGGTSNAEGRLALEKILTQLPAGAASGNARLRLAQGAYARSDWKSAAALARGALAGTPDASTRESALYLLGSSQLQSGQATAAAESFRRQLVAAPKGKLVVSARLGLTYALLAAKQWVPAQAAARATVTAAGTTNLDARSRAQLALAEALMGGGLAKDASAAYLAVPATADKTLRAQAAFGAAQALEKQGQMGVAAVQWGRAAALTADKPEAALAYLRQGLGLVKAKNSAGALTAFEKAAQAAPGSENSARALYEAAWTATDAKQLPRAAGYWKQLDTDYPKGRFAAEALLQQGEIFTASKRWAEAIPFFAGLTTRFPGDKLAPIAWYRSGSARYQTKDFAGAAADFDRAAASLQAEVEVEAHYWAAESYRQSAKPAEAKTRYESFLQKIGSTGTDARSQSLEAKALVPSAQLGLGQMRAALGDAPGAMAAYTAGLPGSMGAVAAELNYRLGKLMVEQKQTTAALPHLLKVSISFPGSPFAGEAQFLAAEASASNGDLPAAKALLQGLAAKTEAGELATRVGNKLKALEAATPQ